MPDFLAAIARLAIDLANLLPSLKPNFLASNKVALLFNPAASLPPALAPNAKPETANGAICVNAWVIFPTVLASASSSNGLTSSNHCSTSLAVSVSAAKSNIVAPSEKTLLGIFQSPVATPANADSKKPTSLSFFFFCCWEPYT